MKNLINEADFEPYGEAKLDAKNRITLKPSGKVKPTSFKIYRNSLGQYILDPHVSVPAYEAGLLASLTSEVNSSLQEVWNNDKDAAYDNL